MTDNVSKQALKDAMLGEGAACCMDDSDDRKRLYRAFVDNIRPALDSEEE